MLAWFWLRNLDWKYPWVSGSHTDNFARNLWTYLIRPLTKYVYIIRHCGLMDMDKASASGAKDCGIESHQGRLVFWHFKLYIFMAFGCSDKGQFIQRFHLMMMVMMIAYSLGNDGWPFSFVLDRLWLSCVTGICLSQRCFVNWESGYPIYSDMLLIWLASNLSNARWHELR